MFEKVPKSLRVLALIVIILVCLGAGWLATRRQNSYSQDDIPLKCLECGFTETLSVAAHHARVQKELPGGAPLIEGPELICPKCGKKAEVVAPPPPPPTQVAQ